MYYFENQTLREMMFDIMQYLSARFPEEIYKQVEMCELIDMYPETSIDILKNSAESTTVKQNNLISFFMDNYLDAVLIGMTGAGKTAFFMWLAEKMHGRDPSLSVYLIGFPVVPGIPAYFHFMEPGDIGKTPENSLIIVDEVGLIFDTKNWNAVENVGIKGLLSLKRQQKKRYLFGSQLSSEISIEMIRRTDCLLLRKFSLIMTETDGRREIYEKLLPFLVDKQEQMLFVSETVIKRHSMVLATPLPSFWNNQISCAFGNKAMVEQEMPQPL